MTTVKQERARRTHERILDAAAREFAVNGYAHTTMQDVARRIGMTKGALYGRFASKEALALALKDHAARRLAALRILVDQDAEPLAALGRFAVGLAGCLREDVRLRAAFRLLADEFETGVAEDLLPVLTGQVVTLAERARQRGLIAPGHDPGDVARLVLCVAFAVQTVPLPGAARPADAWADWAWGRIAASLRGTPD